MQKYERMTKRAGWHKDIDLKDELGYSYIYQRLAELENAIEDGEIVGLPCKVGDTVYIPYKFRNKSGVFETIIEEIRIEEKHISFWAKPLYTNNSIRVKYLGWKKLKDFNKTWFLSKAKAEKKLKELKEKENGEKL